MSIESFDPVVCSGMSAYRAGKPKSANPHPVASDESLRWGRGWETAREIATDKRVEIPKR